MNEAVYNQLQLREIFHLEFLRWLGRKVKPQNYALKGGVNLRFFFNSIRYSEDMDIDASGIKVYALRETVMKILEAPLFQDTLRSFGIEKVVAPNISKAKQTETTQRFKVHLLTASGEDLFTKVEFSRRGFGGEKEVEMVSEKILRLYKIPPLLCPHYNIASAMRQKIMALAARTAVQARDVFDLYILSAQAEFFVDAGQLPFSRARKNTLEINFEEFRDTVVSYLVPEDRSVYEKSSSWDEIKLKVSDFLKKLETKRA